MRKRFGVSSGRAVFNRGTMIFNPSVPQSLSNLYTMEIYELKGEEYIELIKLLKVMRVSESGGQAKLMVEDGIVYLNGVQESRKRAKLRSGDVVEVLDFQIQIK